MEDALFKLGPYGVTIWNLIVIGIIGVVAVLMRRIIHRNLKRLLINSNIHVEGRQVTYLKIISQSVYLIAAYLMILSLSLTNNNVSFERFLESRIFSYHGFRITFFDLLSLALVYVGAKLSVSLMKLFISSRLRNRKDYDSGTEYVYIQISTYIIYMIAIFTAFNIVFNNVTAILTGSAGILLGIGLALQDVFKDFFAGIVLMLEGNLRVGDIIELESKQGLLIAKIEKINVRTSQIETRDGNILIIPNTQLTNAVVENWSHGDATSRFAINVSVAYGSNVEEVMRLMKQAAMSHPKVKKSNNIITRLKEFGDSGLEMELLFWADQSWEINNYKSEIRVEIDRLFRQYNVEIPFPQRDLHIRSDQRESAKISESKD